MDQNLSFMELLNRIIVLENEVKDLKGRVAYLENNIPDIKPRLSKKYMKLTKFLKEQDSNDIVMKFSFIEDVLGFKLPPSAYIRASDWANTLSHSMARSWMGAGYVVDRIDFDEHTVRFKRMNMN